MPSEPGTLPFVSVIIPTYNRKESLLRTLLAIATFTVTARRTTHPQPGRSPVGPARCHRRTLGRNGNRCSRSFLARAKA
jgi:hypothetical protein